MPPRRAGFTLIEMATTVAVLVILLGLMVAIARDVRARSSQELTGDLLSRLDVLVTQYQARNSGMIPPVDPLTEQGPQVTETIVQRFAERNSAQFVQVMKYQMALSGRPLTELPVSVYDDRTIRDAWGQPVIFLPSQHPSLGMAPGDRPFFVSAGPDRLFLTTQDNVYSSEMTH